MSSVRPLAAQGHLKKGFLAFIAVAAGLLGACGGDETGTTGGASGAADETVSLTFASYGGALQDSEERAILNPFAEMSPEVESIRYDIVDYAKLINQVESGNVTWDVVVTAGDFGLGETEKYLEKIDCSVVPCDQLQPDLLPTTGYRVPLTVGGIVVGYNEEKMPGGRTPSGWEDFFNTDDFPGKRVAMADISSFPLEPALLADGVDPDELYPLDVERALAKWETIEDDVTFVTDYGQCPDMVAIGEAVMGACWMSRFASVIKQGTPVAEVWDGALLAPGYLVVPKGTKHLKEAMELVAFATSAEPNANIANLGWTDGTGAVNGPANENGVEHLVPEVEPYVASSHMDELIPINDEYYSDQLQPLTRQWTEWLTGQ